MFARRRRAVCGKGVVLGLVSRARAAGIFIRVPRRAHTDATSQSVRDVLSEAGRDAVAERVAERDGVWRAFEAATKTQFERPWDDRFERKHIELILQ